MFCYTTFNFLGGTLIMLFYELLDHFNLFRLGTVILGMSNILGNKPFLQS